jgi:hypothetical protein
MATKKMKNKIEQIIASKEDGLYKKIAIMAIVTKAIKNLGVKPVIVGGQAVEFYTSGGYTTMDIDMICETSISKIDSKLAPLGFKREGKYWTLVDFNIAIEVPSGPLAGKWDKVAEVEVDDEYTVYIIGIEDIIIDRLNRYKHWNVESDKEWIMGMLYINYQEIDWEYLLDRAKEERTEEELIKFRNIVREDLS